MADSNPPRLVVGLGNPGAAYADTRHNTGAEAVLRAARLLGVRLTHVSRGARWGRGAAPGGPVVLALPQTYMNLSGRAVAALARYFKLSPDRTLLVSDDLNLPLGKLRLRAGGSAGGHNGIQSVLDHLHTAEIPRLRIGIGPMATGANQADFVLDRFTVAERPVMETTWERAAEAIRIWLEQGLEAAMRACN